MALWPNRKKDPRSVVNDRGTKEDPSLVESQAELDKAIGDKGGYAEERAVKKFDSRILLVALGLLLVNGVIFREPIGNFLSGVKDKTAKVASTDEERKPADPHDAAPPFVGIFSKPPKKEETKIPPPLTQAADAASAAGSVIPVVPSTGGPTPQFSPPPVSPFSGAGAGGLPPQRSLYAEGPNVPPPRPYDPLGERKGGSSLVFKGGRSSSNQEASQTTLSGSMELPNLLESPPTQTAETNRVSTARVIKKANRYVTMGSTLGSCVMKMAFSSEIPGSKFTCAIDTDVYGANGEEVVIPKGASVVAVSDGKPVTDGQNRIAAKSPRAYFPPCKNDSKLIPYIDLDSSLTDEMGRTGITGTRVSNFFPRLGTALLVSLAGTASVNLSNRGTTVSAGGGAQSPTSGVIAGGVPVIQREIERGNIPDEIHLKPGDIVNIIVDHDLYIPDVCRNGK